MGTMASQITSLPIVYSTVYSDADQRKHESSASLAFARGIHRGPMNSPHKWPVTRKMFPFDDIIMWESLATCLRRGYVNLLIHTKLYDVVTHPYVQNVWCNYVSMPLSRTKYMISHKKSERNLFDNSHETWTHDGYISGALGDSRDLGVYSDSTYVQSVNMDNKSVYIERMRSTVFEWSMQSRFYKINDDRSLFWWYIEGGNMLYRYIRENMQPKKVGLSAMQSTKILS